MILQAARLYGASGVSLEDAKGSLPVASSEWEEVEPRSGVVGERLFWAPYAQLHYITQPKKVPVALLEWQRQPAESWMDWKDLGEVAEPIPVSAAEVAQQREDERRNEKLSSAYSALQNIGSGILSTVKTVAFVAVGVLVFSLLKGK